MEKEIIFFAEEKKNREVKGGKYLEKENYFFCGGYMRRLRRLYEEKENARDRSVPDGSDKDSRSQHWRSTLEVNFCSQHR